MTDFRNRPHDNYIFNAPWKALYELTEHWNSDIKFYKDELKFLHHIIDKYFSWISKKENINLVKEIEINLLDLEKECTLLQNKITKHLKYLTELINDPLKYDAHQFRIEHEILEKDISSYVELFRVHKNEIFIINNKIIETETLID